MRERAVRERAVLATCGCAKFVSDGRRLLDARPTKLRQVWGGMGVTQRAQCAFEGDVGFEFG